MRGTRRSIVTTVATGLFLVSVPAQADPDGAPLSVRRENRFTGDNELSAHVGLQGSFGGTTPAGAKVNVDYARRITDLAWFDVKLGATAGVGAVSGTCVDVFGRASDCGVVLSSNGNAIDALLGVKLKGVVGHYALLPYGNLSVGVAGVFDRPSTDNGVALVGRAGGGLKVFVTRFLAVGGDFGVLLGPAWYQATCPTCRDNRVELYRAFDVALGVELIL
jgi:hypothetical protein